MRSGRRMNCQRMKHLPSSSFSSFPPSSFLQHTAGVQHSTTRGRGGTGAAPSLPSLAAAELGRCRGPGEAAPLLAPRFSRPLPEGLRLLLLRDRFRDRPRAMVRRGLGGEVSATPRLGMPKGSKMCALPLRDARTSALRPPFRAAATRTRSPLSPSLAARTERRAAVTAPDLTSGLPAHFRSLTHKAPPGSLRRALWFRDSAEPTA